MSTLSDMVSGEILSNCDDQLNVFLINFQLIAGHPAKCHGWGWNQKCHGGDDWFKYGEC